MLTVGKLKGFAGSLLVLSVMLLSGCGNMHSATESGAAVRPVPADDTANPDEIQLAVWQEGASRAIGDLQRDKVFTSSTRSFITRAFQAADIEAQKTAIPVVEEALKADPQAKPTLLNLVRNQFEAALPEDKMIWAALLKDSFGVDVSKEQPAMNAPAETSSRATGNDDVMLLGGSPITGR